MLRPLIATPALALLLITPALGQAAIPAAPTELEQSGLTPPTVLSQGYATTGEDVLVTNLFGQTVFSSLNDDAEEIGTITDMVVTSGLGITAVVVSVGGFLGIGEKEVASILPSSPGPSAMTARAAGCWKPPPRPLLPRPPLSGATARR